MTTLDPLFERDCRAALLDNVDAWLREGGRAEQIIREAVRDALVTAAYDADAVLDTLSLEIARSDSAIQVAWSFDHEAAQFLEFGTSEHTIEGDPVLAFAWPDAPPEVQEMFEATFPTVFFAEVTVDGVAETRFTRDSLRALEAEIQR